MLTSDISKTTKENIIKDYLTSKSSSNLIKKYNIQYYHLYKILQENQIQVRSHRDCQTKYSFNELFFENIETEGQAYWLGFILADGNVSKRSLNISISIKDREHLEKLKASILSNNPLHYRKNKPGQGYAESEFVSISLCSPKLVSDLRELNIVPNKTFTVKPPRIRKDLEKHFWRGVLDGDGHICLAKQKGLKYPRLQIGLCGNRFVLEEFSKYLNSLNIINKIYPDKTIFSIKLTGEKAFLLLSELYKESNIYLDRKYFKYQESLSFQKYKRISTSKYYGVCKKRNRFLVQIYHNKKLHRKIFESEIDAAKYYNEFITSNKLHRPLNEL